jgi:hypothetical protein
MNTTLAKRNTVAALGLLLMTMGCQHAPVAPSKATLDNTAFMTTWGTYRHCRAVTDVDAMKADVRALATAATVQAAKADAAGFVPAFVKNLVARPESRLAADPGAMAAACALSTGQAALRVERTDLAMEMFQSVLKNRGQEYAYYAGQARLGLAAVERALQIASRKADDSPRVLSVSSNAPESRPSAPALLED